MAATRAVAVNVIRQFGRKNRLWESSSMVRRSSSSAVSTSSGPNASKEPPPSTTASGKAEKISRAMKAYLERAKSHESFMKEEIAEYEIGKRHLANIMGEDPDTFDQEAIDRAIAYLLPSGLFDKKARPFMRHPKDVIPKRKAAQFGADGRPFHAMFYTGQPNYYQLMHDIVAKVDALKIYEDRMQARGEEPAPGTRIFLAGSIWREKASLEESLQEALSDDNYKAFVLLMERLCEQPYSAREKEFISGFRQDIQSQSLLQEIPPLLEDESTGRRYQEATGGRKNARAKVRVWENGSGVYTVNGQSVLHYFPHIEEREQLMYPLQFVDKLYEVDVEATVTESAGKGGEAGAIRFATSVALKSFVDLATMERMRLAGLLTRDPRKRERKKPGQAGARKKFTWKKR